MQNRQSMLDLVLGALHRHLPPFRVTSEVVNCHHNYVAQEHHYRANVWVTLKGANGPGRATSASYPAEWGHAAISSGAKATRKASAPAPMVLDAA